jgi:phospholipid/cholesterol/gamma-HCH transport system substrate-binding protein
LIGSLATRLGATSVVVTHDVQGVLDLCDSIALLDRGRVRFAGTPAQFSRQLRPARAGVPRPRPRRPGHGGRPDMSDFDRESLDGEAREPPIPPIHRAKRRELWVGVFVLLGLVCVLFVLFTFTEPSTFRGRYLISTVVEDAGGVRRGDPVELRGVIIGRVRGFDLVSQSVVVRLEIEKRYRIPRDSRVKFTSNTLLGGMAAQVVPGDSAESVSPNAVLPGETGVPLTGAVEKVASESERVMQKVQALLSDRTIDSIQSSSQKFETLLTELGETVKAERTEVDHLMKSLRRTAQNLERQTSAPELEQAIKRLDPLTQKLDETAGSIERASRSMEAIVARVERGEGTLGRLAQDPALYTNATSALVGLERTTAELRSLVKDVRENPKRYVHLSLF